jgi:putative Mn2+ efflux pump MntP
MILEAIVTAIIVSIDGFFTGFSIGIKKTKISTNKLLIISCIPIIMAIPVMLFGNYVSSFLKKNIANYIGCLLFIYLAISSLIQIINNDNNKKDNKTNLNLLSSIIIGFTLGIDSSISAFSLALNHHNPIITPFYFGLSHGILILLGNHIALKKAILKINLTEYLSPILFTIIAIIKLI